VRAGFDINKAVICTDLSEDSDRLVGCAGQLRVLGLDEVVLTYVVDVHHPSDAFFDIGREAVLMSQAESLQRTGMRVKLEVSMGTPGFTAAEVGRNHRADLIVVGSQGKGLSRGPFAGSVSTDVAYTSEVPILIAPQCALGAPEDAALVCSKLLRHVLFAVDFSESASRAFDWLQSMARLGLGSVTLAHVQDVDRIQRSHYGSLALFDAEDASRLERMALELESFGFASVRTVLRHGQPGRELLAEASECGASMILMGRKGRSDLVSQYVGSVGDYVIKDACMPVLMIPGDKHSPVSAIPGSKRAVGA